MAKNNENKKKITSAHNNRNLINDDTVKPLASPKNPDGLDRDVSDNENQVLARVEIKHGSIPVSDKDLKKNIGTYHKMDYVNQNVSLSNMDQAIRWLMKSPARLILSSFIIMILIGTAMLSLPFANTTGEWTSPFVSLFTATSSVTVSGFTLVDTSTFWSFYGQLVILILIQIGGIGLITLVALFFNYVQKKININTIRALEDSIGLDSMSDVSSLVIFVVKVSLAFEAIGAIILTASFMPYMDGFNAVWAGIFQSVSAFNNAGLDILSKHFPEHASYIFFADKPWVILTVAALTTFGGLGFVVWRDIVDAIKEKRKLKFHSNLVLVLTGTILLVGTIFFMIFEWNNTSHQAMGELDMVHRPINALFETATLRTAGFSAIDQSNLTPASKALGGLIMFIGASPLSTGGGMKTTTLAIMASALTSFIRNKSEIRISKYKFSTEIFKRAFTIAFVFFIAFLVSFTALVLSQNSLLNNGTLHIVDIFFESISALSTTGISAERTSLLNTAGHIILMLTMILGRVGPFTIALSFSVNRARGSDDTEVLPLGEVYLG